jgi:hypothetical protein
VYVVIAIDTEVQKSHELNDVQHQVFRIGSYVPRSLDTNMVKLSTDGISWSIYTGTIAFNFRIVPTGSSKPVSSSVYGDVPKFDVCSHYRAVRFSVPTDGVYDVQVQLHKWGTPRPTEFYVVPDLNGQPDTDPSHRLAPAFMATNENVLNDTYVTIASGVTLKAGQQYWWYNQRVPGACKENGFGLFGSWWTMADVFDDGFRNLYRDSSGNSVRITWFVEMDEYMEQGIFEPDGSQFGYIRTLQLMRQFWGTRLRDMGDELQWHHHWMTFDPAKGGWIKMLHLSDYPDYESH